MRTCIGRMVYCLDDMLAVHGDEIVETCVAKEELSERYSCYYPS